LLRTDGDANVGSGENGPSLSVRPTGRPFPAVMIMILPGAPGMAAMDPGSLRAISHPRAHFRAVIEAQVFRYRLPQLGKAGIRRVWRAMTPGPFDGSFKRCDIGREGRLTESEIDVAGPFPRGNRADERRRDLSDAGVHAGSGRGRRSRG